MIQQGGYGQIYGNMGGAAVGASIYKAQREDVTFARMVELQKLNLQKRALRQRQAEAAANADLSRRRLDMESTRLDLEARRLDMVDKQNEEQRLRAEKAYEAKMQEMELRQEQEKQKAAQQEQAARLKLEQQNFDNGMDVTRAGGNILPDGGEVSDDTYNYIKMPGGQVARVPVAERRAAGGTLEQTRGGGVTDAQTYRRVNAVVDSDLKAAEKSVAEAKKNLAVMESRLAGMERDAAASDGENQRAQVEQYRGEVEALRSEIEAKSGGTREMAERYRAALAQDSSLANDVPYTKWRGLPWKDYTSEQRTVLYNLLDDATESGRELVKALVEKREFNPWVAEAWKSAKEKLGEDLAMSPEAWLRKYPYKYVETENPEDDPYKAALRQDGTLLMDVDYGKWLNFKRRLPEGDRGFVNGLLASESRYDRDLLSKMVARRNVNVQAASDWQRAAASRENAVARRIDPGVWLDVKWDTVDSSQKTLMAALLESDKEVDAKAVGAWLYKQTGEQALRAGVPLVKEADKPVEKTGKPAEKPVEAAAKPAEKRKNGLDNGYLVGTNEVVLAVNGQRRTIPRSEWDKLSEGQKAALRGAIDAVRNGRKGQVK